MPTPGRPANGRMQTVQVPRTIYNMYGQVMWSGTVSRSGPKPGAAGDNPAFNSSVRQAQARYMAGIASGQGLGDALRPIARNQAAAGGVRRRSRPGSGQDPFASGRRNRRYDH